MKKSILLLSLLSLLMTGASVKQVRPVSNGTKIFLGTGGAVAGVALGVYLHREAKKQEAQLELLELFKKYVSQDNFRGLDARSVCLRRTDSVA